MPASQRLPPSESRKGTSQRRPTWSPPALRWWNLVIAILICWTFAALLLYFLKKSQNDGGVIFALDINDLPLQQSFAYLYLPTIIAVIFSIYIVWIDIDAKRFEPYRQLMKPGGALGKDSLLLHYPYDFLLFVPFNAFKSRHWLVFCSSLATVLTTFAVVPLQAGLFSTVKIRQISDQSFVVSENFMHSSKQHSTLSLSYTQSVYGILNFNDTLPAFMTREYTLAPFTVPKLSSEFSGTWTANTTMYGLDLQCEEGQVEGPNITEQSRYNVLSGCSVHLPGFGNETVGLSTLGFLRNPDVEIKELSGVYAGYQGRDIYYGTDVQPGRSLDHECATSENVTFFAALVRNKASKADAPGNVTSVFCKTSYYEQDVQATVDAITRAPLEMTPFGPERPLRSEMFNRTSFEQTLASGRHPYLSRVNRLPAETVPRYLEALRDADITLEDAYITKQELGGELPSMLAMTMTLAKENPLSALLNPQKLAEAYKAAYRLLFASAMTDVLKTNFSFGTREIRGQRMIKMEAVVLVPVFVYLVVGLLIAVSTSLIAMLLISIVQNGHLELRYGPGAIAATKSLVADNLSLLVSFEDLDCCTTGYMQEKLGDRRFRLGDRSSRYGLAELNMHTQSQDQRPERSTIGGKYNLQLGKPTMPTEYRLFTAIPFTSLFITLMILLAVLFEKSRPHGLPLPSKDRIVQNVVLQYLPTAIATLIEPIWILINRLLCMLQPLEELQRTSARASRSISLNYNSLPPQLTIIKAARAGHLLLALVCSMALLANLLATAFASLLFQDTLAISRPVSFSPPYNASFVHIDGSVGPPVSQRSTEISRSEYSGAYQGGTGEAHFLASESNYTRNTSLPGWSDKDAMYLPFFSSKTMAQNGAKLYQAQTKSFSAKANCKALVFGVDYELRLWVSSGGAEAFNVTIQDTDGKEIICYSKLNYGKGQTLGYNMGFRSRVPGYQSCRSGQNAAELLTTLGAGVNATQHQQETCGSTVVIGWMRTFQGGDCAKMVANYPSPPLGSEEAQPNNTFLMSCQPRLMIGNATIMVNSAGVLQSKATNVSHYSDISVQSQDAYVPTGVRSLMAQANLFIFRSLVPIAHNDTFASEMFHYFVNRAAGNVRLTDPNEPLPQWEDVEEPLNKAYTRLFAIWLSVNKDLLFVRSSNATTQVPGTIITMEERIVFRTSMFIISEIILSLYIIVAILVYYHRPARYLSRMPIDIASVISLFAASAAVKDLQGTSDFTAKEREEHLNDLDVRYGYGSYIGGDGSVHVGIEKVPFVTAMKTTRFEHSRVDKELRRRNRDGVKDRAGVQYSAVEDAERRPSGVSDM